MSSFNFLIRNSAAAPMLSIIPPDIIPTYEIQLIGAVKKYKIVADNMAIPAMISKHATNFVTDIVFSRSISQSLFSSSFETSSSNNLEIV